MVPHNDILRRITALSKSQALTRGNRRSGENAQRLGFQRTSLSSQQAVQRLQIGGSGLAVMLILVGLASIISDRARMAGEQTVPEAVATTETPVETKGTSDPLVDAGVVPDLQAEPERNAPSREPAPVPRDTTSAASPAAAR